MIIVKRCEVSRFKTVQKSANDENDDEHDGESDGRKCGRIARIVREDS